MCGCKWLDTHSLEVNFGHDGAGLALTLYVAYRHPSSQVRSASHGADPCGTGSTCCNRSRGKACFVSSAFSHQVISRLRLGKDAPPPISVAALAHGETRCAQGYSGAMLVEESRAFQVTTFGTLHLHRFELNQKEVLLDVIVIADEADAQLMETVRGLMAAKLAETAA